MHPQLGILKSFSIQCYQFVILRIKYSISPSLKPRLHILCVVCKSSLEDYCQEKCKCYLCMLLLSRDLLFSRFLPTHSRFLFSFNQILILLSIMQYSPSSTSGARTVIPSISHHEIICGPYSTFRGHCTKLHLSQRQRKRKITEIYQRKKD